MSLINQMLQDLEKRSASGAERGALPNQVRALPRVVKSAAMWWLLGSAAVALMTLLAWQLYKQPVSSPPVARVVPPAPPPAVVPPPAPVPATTPAETPVLPIATAAVIATEPAPSAKSAPASPPKPAPAAPPAANLASAKPAASAAQTAEAEAKAEAKAKAKAKAHAALGDPKIDKRPQQLTPQQLAENEYRLAVNLRNQGHMEEALEGFRRVLHDNPGHIGARQGLLNLLLAAKKNVEAEQVLRDGLKLDPNQVNFVMALARMQVERGDTASAVATLQKTAPAAQDNPDYLAFLAALLQRQSRHQEAIEHYQATLRLAPGSGVWLMGLGISLQALNRNSEAQDVFRRAKETNTLNPELQAFVDQRLRQLR